MQQLYPTNAGTNVLKLTEDGKALAGQEGLYASAVMDKKRGSYIIKIANTADKAQEITLTFKGIKNLKAGKLTTLHATLDAENTVGQSSKVTPKVSTAPAVSASKATLTIPTKTFAVYEWTK